MYTDIYTIFSIAVILMTLAGIKMLSSPRTSVAGNRLGASAMLAAIMLVLIYNSILSVTLVIGALALGGMIGMILALRVTMIRIPQMVAMLNGFGGIASLLVAAVIVFDRFSTLSSFEIVAAQLAVIVGGVTFGGSAVAAAKLDRKISQQPVTFKGRNLIGAALMAAMFLSAAAISFTSMNVSFALIAGAAFAAPAFGIIFAMRIGGADMPITISLLNSYSGLAASICGFAIGDYLLISIGAIVGAAGLILTRIMCRAMNRSLADILTGRTSYTSSDNPAGEKENTAVSREPAAGMTYEDKIDHAVSILNTAQKIIIVPGYGMALAQAQYKVKELYEKMNADEKDVRFAIHPVAGRMPGHMNVLLAEVDIPYDRLCELEDINPDFTGTDAVVIVGACDVVNPAAISAEGTPIYGMPILHVHEAKNVLIFNLDLEPGYSGVENPLYSADNAKIITGSAGDTLSDILNKIK